MQCDNFNCMPHGTQMQLSLRASLMRSFKFKFKINSYKCYLQIQLPLFYHEAEKLAHSCPDLDRSVKPISQIPECICSISHNAPFRTEMCTFLFWMEHCDIWNRCILGLVNKVNHGAWPCCPSMAVPAICTPVIVRTLNSLLTEFFWRNLNMFVII